MMMRNENTGVSDGGEDKDFIEPTGNNKNRVRGASTRCRASDRPSRLIAPSHHHADKDSSKDDDMNDGDKYLSASERKRNREKERRNKLNQGLDELASLLYQIDPSLQTFSEAPTHIDPSRGIWPINSSFPPKESGQTITNRVELIACALKVLKQLHNENEQRKQILSDLSKRGLRIPHVESAFVKSRKTSPGSAGSPPSVARPSVGTTTTAAAAAALQQHRHPTAALLLSGQYHAAGRAEAPNLPSLRTTLVAARPSSRETPTEHHTNIALPRGLAAANRAAQLSLAQTDTSKRRKMSQGSAESSEGDGETNRKNNSQAEDKSLPGRRRNKKSTTSDEDDGRGSSEEEEDEDEQSEQEEVSVVTSQHDPSPTVSSAAAFRYHGGAGSNAAGRGAGDIRSLFLAGGGGAGGMVAPSAATTAVMMAAVGGGGGHHPAPGSALQHRNLVLATGAAPSPAAFWNHQPNLLNDRGRFLATASGPAAVAAILQQQQQQQASAADPTLLQHLRYSLQAQPGAGSPRLGVPPQQQHPNTSFAAAAAAAAAGAGIGMARGGAPAPQPSPAAATPHHVGSSSFVQPRDANVSLPQSYDPVSTRMTAQVRGRPAASFTAGHSAETSARNAMLENSLRQQIHQEEAAFRLQRQALSNRTDLNGSPMWMDPSAGQASRKGGASPTTSRGNKHMLGKRKLH